MKLLHVQILHPGSYRKCIVGILENHGVWCFSPPECHGKLSCNAYSYLVL